MAREQLKRNELFTPSPLGKVIQANLGRASKFADGKTRNWSLFFFFRIMSQAEVACDAERLVKLVKLVNNLGVPGATGETVKAAALELSRSLESPTLMNGKLKEQSDGRKNATPGPKKAAPPDLPASVFHQWLTLLTTANAQDLGATLKDLVARAELPRQARAPRSAAKGRKNDKSGKHDEVPGPPFEDLVESLAGLLDALESAPAALAAYNATLKTIIDMLSSSSAFEEIFTSLGDTAAEAGRQVLSGGLPQVCLYELFRQMAPAYLPIRKEKRPLGIVRAENDAAARLPHHRGAMKWDPAPINFAFTFSGLTALNFDPTTLATFPEAFKDGMAARAERLGDTGPSAPEYWYGALGQKDVHGYFTGGFLAGVDTDPVNESVWRALRDDVRAFNEFAAPHGARLRRFINALFRSLGLEILHIELGEDPYDVSDHGGTERLPYRYEHFGFQDGISQPFVDLKLHDPPAGGGTPGRNRTWSPVAAGEIYLDQPDEDGNTPAQPIDATLRAGSTFLVFRKLKQNVAEFRTFLSKQRPREHLAQQRLAAQFIGRWQNGTSLVQAPDAPLGLGSDRGGVINDFLYAADDPKGLSCPLGAHVRRVNPRDISGTNDVRRHRILRRSIAYGGSLLPDGSLGDGTERGLLFIAANSRIDLQFEVIQSAWINRGELLGQAGLGRCPITGANLGGPSDNFLEAGAVAPVTGIPRFVLTRGGDYFFAPGMDALASIAAGSSGYLFPTDPKNLPYQGYSMGDTKTPELFDPARLKVYGGMLLAGLPPVRVELPAPLPTTDPTSAPVVFVGKYMDVVKVLSIGLKTPMVAKRRKGGKDVKDPQIIYSIAQYHEAGRRISRGHDLIIGTEPGSPTADKYNQLHTIVDAAWNMLHEKGDLHTRLVALTKSSIEIALRRTGSVGKIDLVYDLAAVTVYGIIGGILGTPGPPWLTELAMALPFARQHVGELYPDWLRSAQGRAPDDPGLATMQVWSIVLFADIVGNYVHQDEVMGLSGQAGSEFLTYLASLVAEARAKGPSTPMTLIDAFVANEATFVPSLYASTDAYYYDVYMLLMELAGSAMAIITTAFGSVMSGVLDRRLDLTRLIPLLRDTPYFADPKVSIVGENGVKRLIYEVCRLNPPFGLLMRRCMQDDTLPSGGRLSAGDWVGALVGAANLDGAYFPDPGTFSLQPFLPGPVRNIDNYLLFGAQGGGRVCWGRDRLAFYVLEECVKAAGRLQGLQRVAGPSGKLATLLEVNIGLNARFAGVLPDWKPTRRQT